MVVQKLINVLSIKIRSENGDDFKKLEEEIENDKGKVNTESKVEKELTIKGKDEKNTHPNLLGSEEDGKSEEGCKMSDADLKQKMKLDLEAMIEKQVQGQLLAS